MDQNFMDFPPASFDFLWCRQVLQRSALPLFTLCEYARITKPAGLIYLDVPSTDNDAGREVDPHNLSLLPLPSWLRLFERAGLTTDRGYAVAHQAGDRKETFWSFQLRPVRTTRHIP
jgi:SAM-dependent methyltransferase